MYSEEHVSKIESIVSWLQSYEGRAEKKIDAVQAQVERVSRF